MIIDIVVESSLGLTEEELIVWSIVFMEQGSGELDWKRNLAKFLNYHVRV